MTSSLLIAAIASAAVTACGVAAVKAIARRRRWLDYPNPRASHRVPTPRGGGLAIVLGIVLVSSILLGSRGLLSDVWGLMFAAAFVIAGVSWLDDLYRLPSGVRFVVHIAAAIVALVVCACPTAIAVPAGPILHNPWFTHAIAILWIVGLTNSYNFMDGIDGIAALQSVVAGCGFIVIGIRLGAQDVTIVGAVTAAASIGFLAHNWSPASIFMGDVGSAFLGFLIAVMTIVATRYDSRAMAAGALLVWPFIFDTSFTVLRRLRARENIFKAHRSHLYQRLVIANHSHATVALVYGILAAAGVLSALAVLQTNRSLAAAPYIIVPVLALILWIIVVDRERAAASRPASASDVD